MDEDKQLTKKEKRVLAKEKKRSERRKRETIRRFKNWFVGLLVIVALFVGGYKLWEWVNTPTEVPQDVLEIKENDWIKGNPDAKVTLIEFADFECPACAAYSSDTKRLVEQFPNDIRYIYRHFPLVSTHKNASSAARSAEAAGRQGKFWEMHDLLFERQSDWSREGNPLDKFVSYINELELDEDKFVGDYESDEVKQRVNDDLNGANRLRINSTPTFFLNGSRMDTPRNYDEFKSLIESEVNSN
jgi:protein-disulfide isomerase